MAETGAREVVVTPAVDNWALGVMAYELLTREDAFPVVGGPETVRALCRAPHCLYLPNCACVQL
jgi:serine/threonine protein kinase